MVKAETLAELYRNSTNTYGNLLMNKLVDGSLSYTYSQFDAKCLEISSLLSSHGIGNNDKVAIFSAGHPNWPVAFFSATAFGRVAVPILPDFSANEATNVLAHSESKALFVSSKCLAKITEETMASLDLVVELDSLTVIKETKGCARSVVIPSNNPEDLAVIIYTSGTTGGAKGVMLSHKNFCANLKASYHFFPINENDVMLSVLPLAHAYELSLGMLYPFSSGSSVNYISKAPTPSYLMSVLGDVRPTLMLVVPLLIEKVYKSAVKAKIEKSKTLQFLDKHMHVALARIIGKQMVNAFGGRLRFFGIGGAKLNVDVEKFLNDARFPYFVGYGLTECAPLVCLSRYYNTIPGSIGHSVYGVDVKLDNVNPETGEGEIVVKGDNIMPGYYKDPERTAKAFNDDGWFRTNDLAVVDAYGRYSIKGRLGNMIVGASGENIYPEEIEKVFLECPEVEDVIVILKGGKLVALVKTVKEEIDMKRLESKEVIKKIELEKAKLLRYVNAKVKANSRISSIEIMTVPFEKTATLKIRRFLYLKQAPTV